MSSSKLAKRSENYSNSNLATQLDGRRVLISNIPNEINKEYLELYLEYLSDEVAVERIDFSQEVKNTILVTFSKLVDYNRMKQKHSLRPNCLHNKTDLEEVGVPDTIIVEFNDEHPSTASEELNKELFELYFSNKKRSGGENILKCVYDQQKSRALITYENQHIAQRVASRSHQVNHKAVQVSLFYAKFGKNPFETTESTESSSSRTSPSVGDAMSSSSSRVPSSLSSSSPLSTQSSTTTTKTKKTVSIDKNSLKMSRKFDPKTLSSEQRNYLAELQTIYNELNGSSLNLFKASLDEIKTKKSMFKSDLQLTQGKEAAPIMKNKEFYLSREKSFSHNEMTTKTNPKYYHKSMPDGLDKKRAEFNSSLSLNHLTSQQTISNSNLKKKSSSSSHSLKKTSQISLRPPIESTADSLISTSSAATSAKSSPQLTRSSLKTPTKTQKIIYKNKEQRPPPPKLVKPAQVTSSAKSSESDASEADELINQVVEAVMPVIEDTKFPLVQLKKKLTQRTNSILSLNHDSSSTTNSDDHSNRSRKSIVKTNKLANNKQQHQHPKQTLIKFTDGRVPGEISDTNDASLDKENSSSCYEQRPLACLATNGTRSVCSRTSNKLYKANLAKRNLQSFYGPTINESLNKLTSTHIDFIQSTRYLNKLKAAFPKVSINLNEKMRNLYFFGTSNQVVEAKSRVKYDLDLIKQTNYEIEQKELAEYLKKPEPRQKILKFIETIINRHSYQRLGKNFKFKSLENQINNKSSAVNYCSYQIGVSKRDSNKNILIVNTNMDNMAQFLNKLLNESIRVNQLINIYNSDIVDFIINNDPEWTNFYDLKFKNNVDFTLVKIDSKESNWSLKITGFKEYVDKFIIDFRNKFD